MISSNSNGNANTVTKLNRELDCQNFTDEVHPEQNICVNDILNPASILIVVISTVVIRCYCISGLLNVPMISAHNTDSA